MNLTANGWFFALMAASLPLCGFGAAGCGECEEKIVAFLGGPESSCTPCTEPLKHYLKTTGACSSGFIGDDISISSAEPSHYVFDSSNEPDWESFNDCLWDVDGVFIENCIDSGSIGCGQDKAGVRGFGGYDLTRAELNILNYSLLGSTTEYQGDWTVYGKCRD